MKWKLGQCPNCGHSTKNGGHFVPPSFGDKGFFACVDVCEECKREHAQDREAFEQAIKKVWGWAHRDIAELGFEAGWQAALAYRDRENSHSQACLAVQKLGKPCICHIRDSYNEGFQNGWDAYNDREGWISVEQRLISDEVRDRKACPECGLDVKGRAPLVDGLPCGHPFHSGGEEAAMSAEQIRALIPSWFDQKGGWNSDTAIAFAQIVLKAYAARELAIVRAECEALHEQLRELKRGLRNNNSDFELAFIDAYLDKFRNLTARAEAAEAERDRLKQELDALKAKRS